jgi:hypothetical protein
MTRGSGKKRGRAGAGERDNVFYRSSFDIQYSQKHFPISI